MTYIKTHIFALCRQIITFLISPLYREHYRYFFAKQFCQVPEPKNMIEKSIYRRYCYFLVEVVGLALIQIQLRNCSIHFSLVCPLLYFRQEQMQHTVRELQKHSVNQLPFEPRIHTFLPKPLGLNSPEPDYRLLVGPNISTGNQSADKYITMNIIENYNPEPLSFNDLFKTSCTITCPKLL